MMIPGRRLLLLLLITNVKSLRVKRIVGGEPALPPPEDDPVVFTRFGGRSAKVVGVRDTPHYAFKGIRYAQPPTGKNRFLRPVQYLLNGVENATTFPPPCIQPIPGQNKVVGNEDCLFLNVFTPTLPTGLEGLPVVVWVHGGGFRYGSASQYGVNHLVGKRIIVVTIQYRLGSLGFLSSNTKELPGNAALWDMVLAVQWTRNYIGFFGGNPHRIVVMGHGSGASSAMLVALGNVAKGMTAGVVAMSGSSISRFATDDRPSDTARDVAEMNGCPTGSVLTMVKCLQRISPASVIRGDSQIEFQRLSERGFLSGISGRTCASPVNEGPDDGYALPGMVISDPFDHLYAADRIKMPLLTGITRDETKRAVHGQFRNEIVTKLQTVPNFLDKVLVNNLQSLIGLGNKNPNSKDEAKSFWNVLDPLQFRNYLQVKKNDLTQGLSKIAEVTGDALFNVPAFLTADLWTKGGASAFLYRFDHVGKRRKGRFFLKGVPLVGNSTTEEKNGEVVAHGDELSFIFDVHDLHGNKMDEVDPITEDDAKVRNVFTEMISDFARSGAVRLGKKEVNPFSASDNNFIQIQPEPKQSNNFRFCEMALWCGLTQRLQSSACSLIKVLDSQLKNVESFFDTSVGGLVPGSRNTSSLINPFGTQQKVDDTIKKVTNPFGLINFGQSPRPQKMNYTRKPVSFLLGKTIL